MFPHDPDQEGDRREISQRLLWENAAAALLFHALEGLDLNILYRQDKISIF